MQPPSPTACVVVIGNEILSGRTPDSNLNWLAGQLTEIGIRLMEARVIPDIEQTIISHVRECAERFTHVFTTGGIGPTHDDITSLSIAKAFGVPLARHPAAEAALERHYGREKLNAARLKMADVPEGAALIVNPVSAAPGFRMRNVYVMAGVPAIMQAMFSAIRAELKGGPPMLSRTVTAYLTEGTIAEALADIQARHPDTEIGSYPFIQNGKLGVSLVIRGANGTLLEQAEEEVRRMIDNATGISC